MNGADDERGYATVFVLGLTLIAFAVAGVAIDGTRAFLHRRTLQNAADSAALAAAAELDRSSLYSSGGTSVDIDPQAARRRASEWLRRRGVPLRAAVVASEDAVRIVVRGTVDTTFLRVIGIRELPVAAEASARPMAGEG